MFEDLQKKAADLMNSQKAQAAVEKAKDFINSEKGKEAMEKGKEALATAKDKIEDFVEDKTKGKGIFGFGKKD